MSSVVSGLVCAITLAVGLGFVIPVSGIISDLCGLLAVGSGIVFVALLEGK